MLSIPNFADNLVAAIDAKQSILVAGLDPQLRYYPPHLLRAATDKFGRSWQAVAEVILEYNRGIIDAVDSDVVAVKLQLAMYLQYGQYGMWAFEKTKEIAHRHGLIVIADAKCHDGGDSADAYADGFVGEVPFWGADDVTQLARMESPMRSDCVTVTGYIGDDCVIRFVNRVIAHGTAAFVVDKTSFVPNSRIEELMTTSGLKVWQEVAHLTNEWGAGTEGQCGYRNVGVVMGATKDTDAPWMRETLPKAWKLIPGVGGQGATPAKAVVVCNDDGLGGIVNDSRNLAYAWTRVEKYKTDAINFREAAALYARDMRLALNEALRVAGKSRF